MNPNHHPPLGDPRAAAVRRQEMQTLLMDNQRLAASHVALKQEVLAVEQDVRRLFAAAASIKSENDIQVRQLRERVLKLEAETRSPLDAELDRVRNDVKKLRREREKMLQKLRDVEGQLGARKMKNDIRETKEVKDQIGILCREIQRGRAAVEFERKLQSYNLEINEAMDKHLISLARESEKLRSELANAEKRPMAAVVPAPNPGPGYAGNIDSACVGSSLPDPCAVEQMDEVMEISSQ